MNTFLTWKYAITCLLSGSLCHSWLFISIIFPLNVYWSVFGLVSVCENLRIARRPLAIFDRYNHGIAVLTDIQFHLKCMFVAVAQSGNGMSCGYSFPLF